MNIHYDYDEAYNELKGFNISLIKKITEKILTHFSELKDSNALMYFDFLEDLNKHEIGAMIPLRYPNSI